MLATLLSALKGQVLEEVGGAVGLVRLCARASVNPHADGGRLRIRGVLRGNLSHPLSVYISSISTIDMTHSEAIAQGGGLGGAFMANGSGQSAAGDVAVERSAWLDGADGALGAEPLLQVQREASGSHGGCVVCGRSGGGVLQCGMLKFKISL